MLLSSKGGDSIAFITQVHVIYFKKNYLVRFKKHIGTILSNNLPLLSSVDSVGKVG